MLATITPVLAALLLMSPRLAAAEPPITSDDTSYEGVHAEWAAGTIVDPGMGRAGDDTSYAGLRVQVGGERPVMADEGGPAFEPGTFLATAAPAGVEGTQDPRVDSDTAASAEVPARACSCQHAQGAPGMHGREKPAASSAGHAADHHG
jgi:hypothetical protein